MQARNAALVVLAVALTFVSAAAGTSTASKHPEVGVGKDVVEFGTVARRG